MKVSVNELIRNEGWRLFKGDNDKEYVEAYGHIFPKRHPCLVYLKMYRNEKNPELKFQYMKAAHDYLRPDLIPTWHYWSEERFRAHCEGWNYLTMAGGAGSAKSQDMASIAAIFWLANPSKRGVIISSTTLESLNRRIWGYLTKYLQQIKVPIPFQYTGGNSPKVLALNKDPNARIKKDTLHGMFCLAVKQGDPETAIKDLIGTHPEEALMLCLDECTDISGAVQGAFSNLDSGEKDFQVWGIGNSNSTSDLHGSLSHPKGPKGWEGVDPLKMKRWETTQKNGICLFFSCYDSPAIHETDPAKKKLLSKFLITEEKINSKKVELGENSDSFYRFVLGFWRHKSTESVIASKQFIEGFQAHKAAHYGGIQEVDLVAGLDVAMSSGGDDCMLRLAVLGIDTTGLHVLDFRDGELTFKIPILRTSPDDASLQVVKQVLMLLRRYNIPLSRLVIDATGQGRAMPALFQVIDNMGMKPIGVYSTKNGVGQKESFDVKIKSTYELYNVLKEFILCGQIRGIDPETITQLSERRVEQLPGGKMVLESKKDYKVRMNARNPGKGHSPDHADAAALTLQSAILNFGFALGSRTNIPQVQDFNQLKYIAHQSEQREVEAQVHQRKKLFSPVPRFLAGNKGSWQKKVS